MGLPHKEVKLKYSLLNDLGSKSIRKPLGWAAFWFICAVVVGCLAAFGDIPPGAKDILVWMCGIPVAVVGSSSFEAVKGVKEGNDDDRADSRNDSVLDADHHIRDADSPYNKK